MDLLSVVSVVSGLLSAIAATVGIVIAVKSSRDQETLQREFQAAQERLAKENLKLTMDTKMMEWGARVLMSLNEVELFVTTASEQAEVRRHRKAQLMCTLSELVDEGRWHMPNHTDPRNPDHGKEKGAAYAGYRTRALDAIVYVHDRMKSFEVNGRLTPDELVARIHDSKRVFVSEVFTRIDPKRFLQLIEKPQELPAWMNLPKAA